MHPAPVNTAVQKDVQDHNVVQKNSEVSPTEVKPSSQQKQDERDSTLDSFFDFGGSPPEIIEAKKHTQFNNNNNNNNNLFTLDSEFDFSKNEPIKKQQTMRNDVDDFFDFAKPNDSV